MILLQKIITSDKYSRNHDCIPLKIVDMEIKLHKDCLFSLSIKMLQFFLTLS